MGVEDIVLGNQITLNLSVTMLDAEKLIEGEQDIVNDELIKIYSLHKISII